MMAQSVLRCTNYPSLGTGRRSIRRKKRAFRRPRSTCRRTARRAPRCIFAWDQYNMPFGATTLAVKASKSKRITNRFEHMPLCLGINAVGVELDVQSLLLIDIPLAVFWSILPPNFARAGEL